MFLVISFGVLHAVFLVPVILSFIGPRAHARIDQDSLPGISHVAAINGSIPLECSSDEHVVKKNSDTEINLQSMENVS